jgi:hypothetical protein
MSYENDTSLFEWVSSRQEDDQITEGVNRGSRFLPVERNNLQLRTLPVEMSCNAFFEQKEDTRSHHPIIRILIRNSQSERKCSASLGIFYERALRRVSTPAVSTLDTAQLQIPSTYSGCPSSWFRLPSFLLLASCRFLSLHGLHLHSFHVIKENLLSLAGTDLYHGLHRVLSLEPYRPKPKRRARSLHTRNMPYR